MKSYGDENKNRAAGQKIRAKQRAWCTENGTVLMARWG